MRKLRYIKQIGYELAHHLSGIILIIIRKRKLFILVEKLLPHVALHPRSHHVPRICHIIPARSLYDICHQKAYCNRNQRRNDFSRCSCKKGFGQRAKQLRKRQIYGTDYCCAKQVYEKDRFVGFVVFDEFL